MDAQCVAWLHSLRCWFAWCLQSRERRWWSTVTWSANSSCLVRAIKTRSEPKNQKNSFDDIFAVSCCRCCYQLHEVNAKLSADFFYGDFSRSCHISNHLQVFHCRWWFLECNSRQKWNSFRSKSGPGCVVCMLLMFAFAIRFPSFSVIIVIGLVQEPNNPQFLCTKPFAFFLLLLLLPLITIFNSRTINKAAENSKVGGLIRLSFLLLLLFTVCSMCGCCCSRWSSNCLQRNPKAEL